VGLGRRAILVGLYARAYRHEPVARPLSGRYLSGFAVGVALWLISLLVAPPARFALWAAAMLVELATPLLSASAVGRVPFHASHVPERLALFTIVVLGETVLLAVTGVGDLAGVHVAVAAIGFLVAACLWWSYFELVEGAPLQRGQVAWQVYLYGHLAIFAGITATGVGVQLAAMTTSGEALEPGPRWALCGGAATFYVALSLVQPTVLRVASALALVVLAAVTPGARPLLVEAVLLAVLVAHVALETAHPPRSKK
jgi:low temperature requirement protein LtrA